MENILKNLKEKNIVYILEVWIINKNDMLTLKAYILPLEFSKKKK